MTLWIFIIIMPVIVGAKSRLKLEYPPYCSTEALMSNEMQSMSENLTSHEITWWSTHIKMSINETSCLIIKQNNTNGPSILHTIKYERLEHRYGIAETYQFGVPAIKQVCKCDCPGGETICSVNEYQYRNCTNDTAICYRTHKPFQSNSGCATSGQSELCCELLIDAYRGMQFKAVKLKQPDTFVVLHYRIYLRQNGRWKQDFEDKLMRIPLNTGVSKIEQENHSVNLVVGSGRPHRQVESGMYFWNTQDKRLRGNVPLNEPTGKSLDKLGWFRLERNNQWTIHQGLEKITHAQHVSVDNCKAQRYRFSFTAEQYVLMPVDKKEEPKTYNLGTFIEDEKWVQSVELGDRFIDVVHGEGAELSLNIKTRTRPIMVVHSSQLADISGTIQMDSESNSYMNLTFYDVRGTMIGELYRDETLNAVEMMFSVHTSESLEHEFQSVVAVPGSVNSRRRLCVHPVGDQESQKCVWLSYEVEPLRESNYLRYHWLDAISECEGCNERGFDGFVESLNPKRWLLNGFQTPTDVFVVIVEVALCVAVFLLTILIFTKCIIPMFKCLICVARPLRTSSSRKQLHVIEKF